MIDRTTRISDHTACVYQTPKFVSTSAMHQLALFTSNDLRYLHHRTRSNQERSSTTSEEIKKRDIDFGQGTMGSNEIHDLKNVSDVSHSFGEKENRHQDNHNEKSENLPATAPRSDEEKAGFAENGATETGTKNGDQRSQHEVPKAWYSGLITGAGGLFATAKTVWNWPMERYQRTG
ncbi:hypothetical protein PG984_008880 [Apiospora sp. TS-2023a]